MGRGLEEFIEDSPEETIEELQNSVSDGIAEVFEDETLLQDQSEDNSENLEAALEAMQELELVFECYQEKKAKEVVSVEDLHEIRALIQNLPSMKDEDPAKFFPSLENESDPKVALEGIGETIGAAISKIGSKLMNLFFNLGEHLVSGGVWLLKIQNLGNSLRKLISKIHTNESVTFTYRAGSEFFVGASKEPIENFDEWFKVFKANVSFYQDVMASIGRFTEGDFTRSIRALFSPLSENKFKSDFLSVKRLTDGIIKNPAMQKIGNSRDATIYESKGLLGGYKYLISQPKEELYDVDDYASLRAYVKNFNMNTRRSFNGFGKKVEITVNKRQLEQLLEQIELFESGIKSFCTLGRLFSNLSSVWKVGTMLNLATLPLHIVMLLFANFRMSLKLSWIISKNSDAIFFISRILINRSFFLAKKASKKLIALDA